MAPDDVRACVGCGATKPADRFSVNPGDLCFACKVRTFAGFTFRGVHRWGRTNFHDDTTLASFDREVREGAAANRIEIDRV